MLLGMYLLGIVLALAMAWVFKKTLFRGPQPMLILELPAYKRPTAATALRHAWDQSKLFLAKAGTVILGINILLWFLASYPRDAASERQFQAAKQQLRAGDGSHLTPVELQARLKRMEEAHATARLADSFAGRMGKSIEPVLAPLGFDWKIGVGIVTSFAAREVFVSTMAVLYSVGEGGNHEPEVGSLAEVMRRQRRLDGRLLYTPLTGVSLMVFYVVALQCSSTVVMVRKETGGWKWPLLQWAYLGTLAWVLSFLTYQGGRLLGLG
jgi:ferrous iron transport protein B